MAFGWVPPIKRNHKLDHVLSGIANTGVSGSIL